MEIGQVIRALREQRGIKQESFALDAEISPAVLSRIERGERQPTIAHLRKIAGTLGIEVSALFAVTEGQTESPSAPVELRDAVKRDYGSDFLQLKRVFHDLAPENQRLMLEFARMLKKLQSRSKR